MTEPAPMLPDFPPGTVVGQKYRVERLLGFGGMGAVYAGRHTGTGRGVAIKFLLANEPDLRRRMQREAMALGALAHPNVVQVLDVGDHDGTVFLVMELLGGKSLRDYVDGRILEPAEAIELVMPALQGVEAAHRAGILHRDLKPDNLFVVIDHDDAPYDTKVLDFGIARPIAGKSSGIEITRSGAVVGTPKYMAPEQIRGSRDLGPEVDVFSVGLILYELLVGRSPYDATSYESLIIEIATQPPVSPKIFAPNLPDELVAILLRALDKRPSARFPSILELARALEPFAPNAHFVVPRRAHVASLVDSEDALIPATVGELPEVVAWSEGTGDPDERPSRDATKRHGIRPPAPEPHDDAAMAATAAGPLRLGSPFASKDRSTAHATTRRRIAVAIVAFGAIAIAMIVARTIGRSVPESIAATPSSTPTTVVPASSAPSAAPVTPALAADAPPRTGSTVASSVAESARAVTAHDATPPRTRIRPLDPPATAPPSSTDRVEPPPQTGTAEAHGRAGTIRVDDF